MDASATVGAIEKGASSSAVVNKMVQEIWEDTLQHEWPLRMEHVMISNGVDGISRLHEFRVAARVRRQLWNKWGRPMLDWRASRKLHMLDSFCAKGGGEGTLWDARTVPLEGEFLWVVPPITTIAYALTRIQQEGARGIMVVPLWRTQPYYAWRIQMKAEWVCPWSRSNPIIEYGAARDEQVPVCGMAGGFQCTGDRGAKAASNGGHWAGRKF